ncbi:hypothetical protein DERP_010860 [Dermatophagoides pteronyssinus]|uniref:Uncharacterized protein n=1 Tax=Dermatophagoides pteronyssinus TaxID=6956 RepID=A0ABQ8JUJ0_DERPT|nr:hypothetical protein DERP_010860 [Dermatophagoides pteronyssinus]
MFIDKNRNQIESKSKILILPPPPPISNDIAILDFTITILIWLKSIRICLLIHQNRESKEEEEILKISSEI